MFYAENSDSLGQTPLAEIHPLLGPPLEPPRSAPHVDPNAKIVVSAISLKSSNALGKKAQQLEISS